jgi:hypothetical protein
LRLLISGALVMGYATIACFFFHFWRQTSDRLFAFFATAFVILAVHRLILALVMHAEANTIWLYGLRLAAFLIIIIAIIDKNRLAAR